MKQALNMTPLTYKGCDAYYFFPPFNGESLQSVTVSNETIPRTLCIRFNHSSLKNIETKAISIFLHTVPDYTGRIFGRNADQDGGKFYYELYLTDTDRNYNKLESCGFEISHGREPFTAIFATSDVQNDERKINIAWDYLYSSWLQNSMFEYANEPYYEEYILRNGKPVKLKLYLPIKKRGEETKIILVHNPRFHFIAAKAIGYYAEKTASKTVINYLSNNYRYIIKSAKEFYVRKDINSCVCGVRVNSQLQISDDKNIKSFSISNGNYLVLESSVLGDYDRYTDMLLSFASDNGMTADKKDIFAVYDVKEGFNNPKIRMYCKVKQKRLT